MFSFVIDSDVRSWTSRWQKYCPDGTNIHPTAIHAWAGSPRYTLADVSPTNRYTRKILAFQQIIIHRRPSAETGISISCLYQPKSKFCDIVTRVCMLWIVTKSFTKLFTGFKCLGTGGPTFVKIHWYCVLKETCGKFECTTGALGSECVVNQFIVFWSGPNWFQILDWDIDRVQSIIIIFFNLGIPVVQPFLYQPLTGQIVQPSIIRGRVYVPSTTGTSDSSYYMPRQEMVRHRIHFRSFGNYVRRVRNYGLIHK